MSADPSVPAVRRDRAIRLTVGASVAAKVLSIACTLVQVPIALHYLGAEAYGFWMTITSVVLILNTIDFGVGVGIQHAMATAFGRDDLATVRQQFWTGVAVLVVLATVTLLAGGALIRALDWADLLKIGDPTLRTQTRFALAIALASFAVSLPFNAVNRLAAAVQRGWINSGWVAAGSCLSLILVGVAAGNRWTFPWFLCASLLLPALQGAGLWLHLFLGLGWTLRPTRLAAWEQARSLVSSSLWYAVPQAGQALVQSVPALAISVAAGPDAVTAYSLLMRLYGLLQQGQVLLLTPVWPAYTEASVRGDRAWVRRTYGHSLLIWVALAVAAAAISWSHHVLLRVWVGSSADLVSDRLALVVGLWCVAQMAAQPPSYLLMGLGRLRELAWAASPGFFFSVGACFWGSRAGTAAAVLAAGGAAFAALALPPLLVSANRILGSAPPAAVPA